MKKVGYTLKKKSNVAYRKKTQETNEKRRVILCYILIQQLIFIYNFGRIQRQSFIFLFRGYGRDGKRRNKTDKLSPTTVLKLAKLIGLKCKKNNVLFLHVYTRSSIRYLLIILLTELKLLV